MNTHNKKKKYVPPMPEKMGFPTSTFAFSDLVYLTAVFRTDILTMKSLSTPILWLSRKSPSSVTFLQESRLI